MKHGFTDAPIFSNHERKLRIVFAILCDSLSAAGLPACDLGVSLRINPHSHTFLVVHLHELQSAELLVWDSI